MVYTCLPASISMKSFFNSQGPLACKPTCFEYAYEYSVAKSKLLTDKAKVISCVVTFLP